MRRLAAILGLLALVAIAAVAQDTSEPEGSDGFLMNLLERRLSTPTRQIRLHGVTGALSSRARIAQITISDPAGRWLEIDNVELDWSRLALLRGRVNINRLSAERITWMRRPQAPAPTGPSLPSAEATPFALPELPVSVNLAELALADVRFDEAVFGRAARISVGGSLNLARGVLESDIAVRRLDGPGGELTLRAGFSNATRQLDVDLDLHEPQGGLVATLLRIEGEPAIDLTAEGSGPIDDVDVTFALDADGTRVAGGLVALRSTDEGLGFDVDFSGEIAPLVPPDFRDFFAGESTVRVSGVSKAGGGLRIATLAVDGAALRLDGDLETGADGFLRDLTLTGSLGDPAGEPVVLPVPGGRTRLQSGALHVNFGDASRWNGLVVLDRLEAADIAMEDVTLRLGGLAQNLEDPARRNVTINVEGLATGVWHADPEVARALGEPHRPLRRRGAAARGADPGPPAAAQRQRPVGVQRRRDRGHGLHRAQRRPGRRPRDPRGHRAAAARRRDRPARRRQRQPAVGRLRPRLRRRRHRPRARRPAARRAARRRDDDLRPGGARRDRLPHRGPADREPAAQLRLERAGLEHAHRHRLRRPRSPTSRRSTRGSAAR